MSKELEFDCDGGECVWRWNANDFPVDEITIRVRGAEGDMELREVPNNGRLVLPEDEYVMEIVSTGEGGARRRERWRGPG